MGLSLALNNALSGIQAAQNTISAISANLANINTPGYTLKIQPLTNVVTEGIGGSGVHSDTVIRQVDNYLATDVQTEDSSLGASQVQNNYTGQLQNLFGDPTTGGTVGTALNNFSQAIDSLATAPEQQSLQSNVVATANTLTTTLHRVSTGVQTIRANAFAEIGSDVTTVNSDLQNIATLNGQIARAYALQQPIGDLQDQRDKAVTDVAQYIDINTFQRSTGELAVYTTTGKVLVDGVASQLQYTTPSTVNAQTQVPQIILGPNGSAINSDIHSGKIGALLQLTGTTLPNATAQLNSFAEALYGDPSHTTGVVDNPNNLTSPPSTNYPYGRLATSQANVTPNKLTLDLNVAAGSIAVGDTLKEGGVTATVTNVYTDPVTNAVRVSVTGVAGGAFTLPVPLPSPTTNISDTTSGATASLLGINDSNRFFAGVDFSSSGPLDNAQNIIVHPDLNPETGGSASLLALANDPYVKSLSQTLADTFRNNFTLTSATGGISAGNYTFSSFSGNIVQTNATLAQNAATNLSYNQQYQNALTLRATAVSGVNLDEELSKLVVFQNAYNASAQVVSTTSKLFDTLLSLGR